MPGRQRFFSLSAVFPPQQCPKFARQPCNGAADPVAQRTADVFNLAYRLFPLPLFPFQLPLRFRLGNVLRIKLFFQFFLFPLQCVCPFRQLPLLLLQLPLLLLQRGKCLFLPGNFLLVLSFAGLCSRGPASAKSAHRLRCY